MEELKVGTVVWEMRGIRQDNKIKWHAEPRCIESVDEHMYRFTHGAIRKNGLGKSVFLTRQEAIDDFIKGHGSLEEDIGVDEPLSQEQKGKVTERPRTDWNDLTIVRFDGVTMSSVYIGFVNELHDITKRLNWRKIDAEEYGYHAEGLTLKEIYDQVSKDMGRPIITVFVNDPMHGEIYQCGNYADGKWVKYGTTIGYA